jgi:predicted Zn-dependent peptidase
VLYYPPMKQKITTLPNGLRVLLIPMKEHRTATALVLVETGSKYETKEQNGISHFLEHMCFKGTTRRSSQQVIAEELDRYGAEFNAFTGHEYTGYYTKTAAGFLPKTLDLLADIYTNSLFKEEDITQEKGAIIGEINMYEDMPMRKVADLFMALTYGDQPAGWEIAGPKERVLAFTREDFISYRTMHYVPSSTLIVVSGKFEPKATLALVKKMFGGVPSAKKKGKLKVKEVQTSPQVLIRFKESDQTHVIVGVRAFPVGHRSHYPTALLAGVLGVGMSSRLFQKVRTEMGLGYYVRASHESFTDHGLVTASAGVVNERAEEAVAAIVAEFERLKVELVSEAELSKAKEMFAGRLLLGLESSDEIAEFYGGQEILREPIESPEEVIAKIRAVTPAEIRAVARKIFTNERLNCAAIGPWKDDKGFRKVLHF